MRPQERSWLYQEVEPSTIGGRFVFPTRPTQFLFGMFLIFGGIAVVLSKLEFGFFGVEKFSAVAVMAFAAALCAASACREIWRRRRLEIDVAGRRVVSVTRTPFAEALKTFTFDELKAVVVIKGRQIEPGEAHAYSIRLGSDPASGIPLGRGYEEDVRALAGRLGHLTGLPIIEEVDR